MSAAELLAQTDLESLSRHPIVVPLAVAAVLSAFAGGWQALRILQGIRRDVLPHFTPPEPGERDNTLPGRVARTEQSLETARLRLERSDERMDSHFAREEAKAASIDDRLGKIERITSSTAAQLDDHLPEAKRRDERIAHLEGVVDAWKADS